MRVYRPPPPRSLLPQCSRSGSAACMTRHLPALRELFCRHLRSPASGRRAKLVLRPWRLTTYSQPKLRQAPPSFQAPPASATNSALPLRPSRYNSGLFSSQATPPLSRDRPSTTGLLRSSCNLVPLRCPRRKLFIRCFPVNLL